MTDFDVHGLARVRVLGTDDEARIVERQLGPLRADPDGDADIVIEFVDALETGTLRYLGRNEWAHDDDGLVVLRGRRKSSIRARLPLDAIGHDCRIVVERGADAVPFLIPIVNLVVLAHGGLPLHAAAFELDGVGVLVTGWSKGGKTESLLAALDHGARYVGDEWVYLSDGGARAVGVPEPIRVWDWYRPQLSRIEPDVGRSDALRSGVLRAAVALSRAGESPRLPRSANRWARRVGHLVDTQRHVDLPVASVTSDADASPEAMAVHAVVHTVGVDRDAYRFEPADAADVAARMAGSLAFERLPLMALYHAFRYAFPERRSDLIERAHELETERLAQFLVGRPCWESSHPYPPDLARLWASMSELWAR